MHKENKINRIKILSNKVIWVIIAIELNRNVIKKVEWNVKYKKCDEIVHKITQHFEAFRTILEHVLE